MTLPDVHKQTHPNGKYFTSLLCISRDIISMRTYVVHNFAVSQRQNNISLFQLSLSLSLHTLFKCVAGGACLLYIRLQQNFDDLTCHSFHWKQDKILWPCYYIANGSMLFIQCKFILTHLNFELIIKLLSLLVAQQKFIDFRKISSHLALAYVVC